MHQLWFYDQLRSYITFNNLMLLSINVHFDTAEIHCYCYIIQIGHMNELLIVEHTNLS